VGCGAPGRGTPALCGPDATVVGTGAWLQSGKRFTLALPQVEGYQSDYIDIIYLWKVTDILKSSLDISSLFFSFQLWIEGLRKITHNFKANNVCPMTQLMKQ
jgi:hypothetical protein